MTAHFLLLLFSTKPKSFLSSMTGHQVQWTKEEEEEGRGKTIRDILKLRRTEKLINNNTGEEFNKSNAKNAKYFGRKIQVESCDKRKLSTICLVISLLEAKQLAGPFLEVGRREPVWMQIRKNIRESIGGGLFAPLLSLPWPPLIAA